VTAARRVALVTGAGRRVGQAIAVGLAGDGFDVAIHYHGSEAGATETLAAIERLGRKGTLLAADLRDALAARGLADRTVKALGGLHALVNSAPAFSSPRGRSPICAARGARS